MTLTKSLVISQVTEMRALTKSLRSPSRRGGDQATYNLLLRAPTILGKLREKHLCRGATNHSRVAEGTRPSPEGVYSGVS